MKVRALVHSLAMLIDQDADVRVEVDGCEYEVILGPVRDRGPVVWLGLLSSAKPESSSQP